MPPPAGSGGALPSSAAGAAPAGSAPAGAKLRPRLKKLLADSATMQGRRPKQEDRHVKVPDFAKAAKALKMPIDHLDQPCAFFAVYDGHQGPVCAEFAAKGFHMKLLKRLTGEQSNAFWTDDRLCGALREVCEELDVEFLAKYRTAPDGSTVVAALITGARLFVAWVGDSRCLLCRHASQGGIVTVALTDDHRPSTPSETDRVKKAGGIVVNFDGALRVAHEGFDERIREIRRAAAQGLGTIGKEPVALAVSRSLGDRDFKAVTGKALLVATPSVRSIELSPSCKFIVLMCDGISDVMSNEQVVFELDFVREPGDPAASVRKACGGLVQEAYKRGSGDNLTAILVQFEWEGEGPGSDTGREDPALASDSDAKRRRVGEPKNGTGHASNVLGPGHFLFRAQPFWQEVLPEQVTTPGLETRRGAGEERCNFARLAGGPSEDVQRLGENDPRLLEAATCVALGREDEAEVAAVLRRAAASDDPVRLRHLIASSFVPASACAAAFCEAAGRGHAEVAKELLRARAALNADGAEGKRTPLHLACLKGQERVGELLIAAKADLSMKDSGGRTPCDLAREQEFGMMAKRLEALGKKFEETAAPSPITYL